MSNCYPTKEAARAAATRLGGKPFRRYFSDADGPAGTWFLLGAVEDRYDCEGNLCGAGDFNRHGEFIGGAA